MSPSFDGQWRPPRPSDLGGPEQLADVLIDFRHWHATKGLHANGEIPDEHLRWLIKLAYFASQTADEGRYPQFRIFCPAAGSRSAMDELRIFTFQEPRPLRDVNSLRKLAPLVASRERALLVMNTDQGLVCHAVVAIVRPTHLGPPQHGISVRPEGLMLRVDGPGTLQATEAGLTFILRAGTVQNLSPYHQIEPVKHWFAALAETLLRRCASAEAPEEQTSLAARTPLRMLITSIWSDVLHTTLNLRHGGAFIVVPDPAKAPLVRKHEIRDLDLGAEIESYWQSRRLVEQQQQKSEIERSLQMCQKQWHRLITRAHAIAHLTSVDGCVVLDRELRVDSFGAFIHVDRQMIAGPRRPEMDYWTREIVSTGENFGTRHHSARNLCLAQSDAFAFVVSQDGDLTLYFSDAHAVYRSLLLSPADGVDW